ncbi:MAG: DUF485 domain-containing protein [Zoogloeaceae bacterium]|jgi:uncharacterized membrane protein (DUF485 family)|nr:DUF485 domain-containing protein [Zoogloeaceae bacterium]
MKPDDFYRRLTAHPRYAALAGERRRHARHFAGMSLLAFAGYLLLANGAADWLARPVWAGLSITWLWLLTFWCVLFIVTLVVCVAHALQELDARLAALMEEVRDAPG